MASPADDTSAEVVEKIEPCLNMFPQPTQEQLEQFKELQESSMDMPETAYLQPELANTIRNI